MTGRRFNVLPGSLQGRGPQPIDPRAAAAMANGVPIIGEKRVVSFQLTVSDKSSPMLLDMVRVAVTLLSQQLTPAKVDELRASIEAGTESPALFIGDAQSTIEIVEELRAAIIRSEAAVQRFSARQKAAQAAPDPQAMVDELVKPPQPPAADDGPAPVTEGS